MTDKPTSPRCSRVSRWHPRVGLVSAVFVVSTVASGLLINHSQRLDLGNRYVASEALLDWYAIRPPEPPVAVKAGTHWISQVGGRIYFDDRRLPMEASRLAGAVDLGDPIVVAGSHELIVLTRDGRVVEKLSGVDGVPAGISEIGVTPRGQVALRAAAQAYLVDLEDLAITPRDDPPGVRWSRVTVPPAALAAILEQDYRGAGLTLERVLLDVHSGRILGRFGVLLIDLTAVLFLFLALSGMWMRLRPRRDNGPAG